VLKGWLDESKCGSTGIWSSWHSNFCIRPLLFQSVSSNSRQRFSNWYSFEIVLGMTPENISSTSLLIVTGICVCTKWALSCPQAVTERVRGSNWVSQNIRIADISPNCLYSLQHIVFQGTSYFKASYPTILAATVHPTWHTTRSDHGTVRKGL
jgi:hypothetical protein